MICFSFHLTDIHYKGANLRLEVVKTMKHLLSKYCCIGMSILWNSSVLLGNKLSAMSNYVRLCYTEYLTECTEDDTKSLSKLVKVHSDCFVKNYSYRDFQV